MSDFKVGDKIRRPMWRPEFWMQVEWVGDFTYAGRREGGQDCLIRRNEKVELWTPPFPFKAGEWITDGRGEHRWLVVGPSKDPNLFLGKFWTKTGGLREDVRVFEKKCYSGEWVLCPKHPFEVGDLVSNVSTEGLRVTAVGFDRQGPWLSAVSDSGAVWTNRFCGEGSVWTKFVAPKQDSWTVTTESRVPVWGDRYMKNGKVMVATPHLSITERDVIVKITRNKE